MKKLGMKKVYSSIFNNAMVAIGITDREGHYKIVNPAWCEFTGYTEQEAKKLSIDQLVPAEDIAPSRQSFEKLIKGEVNCYRKAKRYQRKDGRIFWVDLHVSALYGEDNQIIGVIGILVDIDRQVKAENQQKELNKALTKLARHDSLTGLYNRRALEEILLREHRRAVRYQTGFAVAILDVDNFKRINDIHGHDCGDVVMQRLADIFLRNIRDTDTVGRWGGEEFLFIFSNTTCDGANVVAERIRKDTASKTLECNGKQIPINVTIGFSYHHGQSNMEDLIVEADKALYDGKRNGKNQVRCFQEECSNRS